MSKRFTDTEIWKKQWFCELSPALKSFWRYVCDSCDNSGVWTMNLPLAQFQIGAKVTLSEILAEFKGNIVQISEEKLFIIDFIDFQFGELSRDCKPHNNIFKLLEHHGIGYPYSIDTLLEKNNTHIYKDKDKDKDKEEYKEKAKSIKTLKPKKDFVPPTYEEYYEYCKQEGFENIAERSFKGYSAADWHDTKGQKILSWKQKLQNVWFKLENKTGHKPQLPQQDNPYQEGYREQ
jgi:hypothetical protein